MKTKQIKKRMPIIFLTIAIVVLLAAIIIVCMFFMKAKKEDSSIDPKMAQEQEQTVEADATVLTLEDEGTRKALLDEAEKLATGYDYDKALETLRGADGFESYPDITAAIASYEKEKASLIPANVLQIPHIFFHPLVYDTDAAFKNNKDSSSVESLNTAMTTVDEFNAILEQLYENDYVLVSLHDAATVVNGKNGKKKLKEGKILLPKGKKPIIISEDDVNYYDKWKYKGVASRLIMDENGKPSCEVDLEDGTTITGDYDVAPCLERFIEKHPDFSYQGARAVLVVTGREGVWGYRTSKYIAGEDSNSNVNSEKDFDENSEESKKAKAVSQGLRDAGYELGSHSFVHEGLGYCSMHLIKYDTKRWENECESLIGESDIIIYPKGEDIEHGESGYKYVKSNPRFSILSKAGFLFYCNVDGSNPYWTVMGKNYFRQARIALDGNVMYYQKKKLKQFYGLDVNKIWDKGRPKKAPLSTY